MNTIKIGSRQSALAIAQSKIVADAIKSYSPGVNCELVTMTTTGDRILDKTLDKIGGKGLFTEELDRALLDGRIDIAVHSAKDLPAQLPEQLPIAAFSKRADVRDVLILPHGAAELDVSKPIGSSSKRREHQLRLLYPEAEFAPVRGNVNTRLEKMDAGEYSALILAAAGLRRLGLDGRISRYFTVREILPAACQGILAVQARAGEDTSCLNGLRDTESEKCALAERAFIAAVEGTCSSPIGAYAHIEKTVMHIDGLYVLPSGKILKHHVQGPAEDFETLGHTLGKEILGEV